MPEKLNIILDAKTLQEFRNQIQNLVTKYFQILKQPAQEEDKLLFEDVPKIEIRPKSVTENSSNDANKRPKNIGIFSNPAKGKDPKIVEDGGKI